MTEYLIIFIVAFICFGFVRRFFYFQAYQSFTKAAHDFRRDELKSRKPEGTVTIESSRSKRSTPTEEELDDEDYEEWEEVK